MRSKCSKGRRRLARPLSISNRAHVIFPFHRLVEKMREARANRVPIGTTSRGIGPCYEDKIARRGIRVADLMNTETSRAVRLLAEDKQILAEAFDIAGDDQFRRDARQYRRMAEKIRPMVCDTARLLNDAIAAGKRILFEGAQGTMLDIDHGTYPFVTSSSAAAGGACTGTGVPPTPIDGVIGVSKAYITRVGGGPFPSEDRGEGGERIREARAGVRLGNRKPAALRLVRRAAAALHGEVNGFDCLIVTKLDVLDGFDSIPVCVAYRLGNRELRELPPTSTELQKVEPVYECLPGWKTSTFGAVCYDNLPSRAKDYLAFLGERTGIEVGSISTGPERNQTIVQPDSRLAKLLT